MSLDDQLRDWAEDERAAPPPSPERTAALIAAAEQRKTRRHAPLIQGFALAAAALLAVLATWSPAEAPPTPTLVEAPAPPPAPDDAPSPFLPEGAQALGADRLTVAPGAQVRLLEGEGPNTRLSLEAGRVEAQVAPRGPGESFVIRAAEHEVRVVGTRFLVQAEPFWVEVSEGVVEVVGAQRWRLEAGDRFEGGQRVAARRAPEAPPPPELSALRAQVLAGELDAARAGLQRRLSRDDTEVAAWMLLAQLERKAGDRAASVSAWRAVIRVGPPAEAQRARFEAARLLEGQPAEVEALMRDFLQTPDPLAPEARLRLAQALQALQRPEEAAQELRRVVTEHPGDPAASRARSMLQQIDPGSETSEGAQDMER